MKIEQPYNQTEIGLSQAELKTRHTAIRKEFRRTSCLNCKHKKHNGRRCYAAMGQPGGITNICACGTH